MMKLGVNIDHVATIRQARRANEPDPVEAAFAAERAGADGITVHLREDRRHIQDRDVKLLRQTVRTRLNLEMGLTEEILRIALEIKPDQVTLVPENRQEVTTEGGLDVAGALERIQEVTTLFQQAGIRVSLFIDPDPAQVRASAEAGAEFVELHTGAYANTGKDEGAQLTELEKLYQAAQLASELGLRVNGGHGLTYQNVIPVAAIPEMEELNIGHSIISRALGTGLEEAAREMKRLMQQAQELTFDGFEHEHAEAEDR